MSDAGMLAGTARTHLLEIPGKQADVAQAGWAANESCDGADWMLLVAEELSMKRRRDYAE